MEDIEKDNWIGRKLGKYKLIKLLGRDFMGTVYQAIHEVLDKIVCVKILSPVLLQSSPKSLDRFMAEARVIANLAHPNIICIYGMEKEEDFHFIVMEYVDGKTVAQILEEKGSFSTRETIEIGIQIAEGLAAAHKQNIIHEDVKPAHILIQGKNVKITNFGLSRYMYGNEHEPAEYINGEAIDARMDLKSLGITLFQMLSGYPPYTGQTPLKEDSSVSIPSIKEIRPDVPCELDDIIKKLMSKNPTDCFQTAKDVVQALGLIRVQDQRTTKMMRNAVKKTQTTKRLPAVTKEELDDKIRVLVVDDSITMCNAISGILKEDPLLAVVGMAHNGKEALEMIPRLHPHIIILDLNMPEMDGLTAIKHIMVLSPTPVLMLSAFTHEGAMTTLECLSCGAVDFMWKTPQMKQRQFQEEFREKIRSAAHIQLFAPKKPRIAKILDSSSKGAYGPARSVVAMGGGDGGLHTCLKIIPYIPQNITCAIVLIQEMPDEMLGVFVSYLNYYSRIVVKQINSGEILNEGVCYVSNHLSCVKIEKCSEHGDLRILKDMATISQPSSFLQLLSSCATECGNNAIGIALSGNTKDAVEGLRQMKEKGGVVIVQDPVTCLKADTPQLAIEQRIHDKVVLDIDIPSVIWYYLKTRKSSSTSDTKALRQTSKRKALQSIRDRVESKRKTLADTIEKKSGRIKKLEEATQVLSKSAIMAQCFGSTTQSFAISDVILQRLLVAFSILTPEQISEYIRKQKHINMRNTMDLPSCQSGAQAQSGLPSCQSGAQAQSGLPSCQSGAQAQRVSFRDIVVEQGVVEKDVIENLFYLKSPDGKSFIPNHEVKRLIGEGGMAAVYYGLTTSLPIKGVAIKVFPSPLGTDNSLNLQRFIRECELMKSIRHPGIVPAYEYGEFHSLNYMVMRHISGISLEKKINQRGHIEEKEALDIFGKILEAMSAVWHEGVINRDIKPSNIMITGDGDVKICDFGLAKIMESDAQLTQMGMIMGTPYYMSPEQCSGHAVDYRSDVYSLGISLYKMITGHLPFSGSTYIEISEAHISEPPPHPSQFSREVSPPTCAFLLKMLAKEPGRRCDSPEGFLEDFRRVKRGEFPKGHGGFHDLANKIIKFLTD